jgi:hypothetical protein
MPFSLTEIELKQAIQESGCPLCWIGRNAAERYIRHLLWESVNDMETRRHFIAGLGYCPEHTRILATREIEEYGDALGVNIIYENLANVVAGKLENLDLLKEPGPRKRKRVRGDLHKYADQLVPSTTCRVCQSADSSMQYALKTLLEEFETSSDEWQPRYLASDGLCLSHLKQSLNFADQFPTSARFLREDVLSRMKRWQEGLQGYIQKHNWDLRKVPLTENERQAWREVLAFFTGQTPSSFDLLKDSRSR